ncbi:MAG TPA: single-stranded DNA-binding protein [Acidimicrobiales bacterium]|nr:single-stranded DNA-binding protein [Acidimicrobiales bacterium]
MNTISIIGRLTRDPELDRTTSGTDVCRIRLAVPRRRKEGRDQGAVFVTVVAYGGQAAAVAGFLAKGRQVGVTGRLEYREWTDSDGRHQSVHEVVADHVEFLSQPTGNGSDAPRDARLSVAR